MRVGTESFVDLIMAEKYWNGSVFMEIGVVRSYSIQCIEKQRILAIEYGLRPCGVAACCVSLLGLVMPRRATSKIKPDQNPIGLIGGAQFLAKISVMLLVIHAIKWQTSC